MHGSFVQPHPATLRGFTLLELVLVMMIVAIMLAVAMPSLRGFAAGSRSRDAVTQVVALAQFAKSRAAADAKIYRLNVNGSQYWLTAMEGEAFVPLGTDFGQIFDMPMNMRIEVVPGTSNSGDSSRNSGGIDTTGIAFYPDGRSDTALLRLTEADGKTTLIGCPSPAESFRVMSAEEAARL